MDGMKKSCLMVMALVCGLCVVVAWRDDSFLYQSALRKRSGPSSTACRLCYSRPSDWRSCQGCVARRAVPYGGSAKRSVYTDYLGSDVIQTRKRGSFMECRCCLSLRRRDCCDRCNVVEEEEEEVLDQCDVCCDPQSFDFYCCMECSRR